MKEFRVKVTNDTEEECITRESIMYYLTSTQHRKGSTEFEVTELAEIDVEAELDRAWFTYANTNGPDSKVFKDTVRPLLSFQKRSEPMAADVEKSLSDAWDKLYSGADINLSNRDLFKEIVRPLIASVPYQKRSEVKKVRTGVLDLPEGYILKEDKQVSSAWIKGNKVNLSDCPQLERFCKDICEEIDWSSVKPDTFLVCKCKTDEWGGYFVRYSTETRAVVISIKKGSSQNTHFVPIEQYTFEILEAK